MGIGIVSADSLLRLLPNRGYRYIIVDQAISGLDNGVHATTLAWIYSATGSTFAMGVVLRRRVILVANVVAKLAAHVRSAAVGFDALNSSVLICCSFLLGLSTAFLGPAFRSIFKEILTLDELRGQVTPCAVLQLTPTGS